MFVFARALWLAILTALGTRPAGAVLAGNIRLYTNNAVPGPNNVAADFTAPTYTSYADAAYTVGAPFVGTDGALYCPLPDVTFSQTSGDTPTDIFGYILVDGSGNYQGGAALPSPYHLSGPGSALQLGQNIRIDPSIQLGAPDIEP